MTNRSSVHLISYGAATALGTAAAALAAVRAGLSAFEEHEFMTDSAGKPMITAALLPADIAGAERFVRLAEAAMEDCFSNTRKVTSAAIAAPLCLALPEPRNGLPNNLETAVQLELCSDWFRGRGVSSVETFANGRAGGFVALRSAVKRLQTEQASLCWIGGIDSYLEPETLKWLEDCEQLRSAGPHNNASGFVPGEAAGFCLLANAAALRDFNLNPIARIRSVALTRENNRIKTDAVRSREGLGQAISGALTGMPSGGAKVTSVVCDLNGESYRGEEYLFASSRRADQFVDPADIRAPAENWGDVGAASLPLFMALAKHAVDKGYAQGPHALLCSGSESGLRGCSLLEINSPPIVAQN